MGGSYAGLSAFLVGTGETDGSGSGCWIRVNSPLDAIHTEWAGHDVTGVNDSTASVNACINKFGSARPIRISPGTLKISFPTTYQYHELFNVARKTAFVINAKNNLTIFAENDVNINTDGGGESERVCFGVIGCSNFSFSGLNSIRHAQTFRPGQKTQLSSRRKIGSVSHGTWHGKSINNHFVDPISLQSRVGPWGVRKSMTITGDTKSGGGIFVEIGGTSGPVAPQYVTITNCVSDGAINADGTQSTHILIIGDEGDYATSFNSIRIINNTLRGGYRAIQDYNVGLLGKKATGLVIEDNNLDRPDRVTITSSAWGGTVYRNNKTHIQFGNQGCIIAGQYPTISGNDFDSTSLLAANLGSRIDGANVENNNFSNNLSNPISRVMDWDSFAAMTYRNNRYIGLTGVDVFRGGGRHHPMRMETL